MLRWQQLFLFLVLAMLSAHVVRPFALQCGPSLIRAAASSARGSALTNPSSTAWRRRPYHVSAAVASLSSTASSHSSFSTSSSPKPRHNFTFPLQSYIDAGQPPPPRVRFAPSPTGSLHVGGARTALFNWLIVEQHRRRHQHHQHQHPPPPATSPCAFILRIEDTDAARSTAASEASVLKDLLWLGLKWDEGPNHDPSLRGDHVGQHKPYRQSERMGMYGQAVQYLLESKQAYYCFATDEELEKMKEETKLGDKPNRYVSKWRNAPKEEVDKMFAQNASHTVRFKVPDQPGLKVVVDDLVRGRVTWDVASTLNDFIIFRSDKSSASSSSSSSSSSDFAPASLPVYNFAAAVDDALMGVTHVLRAEEHLPNTLKQVLLLRALGAPSPRYGHLSLILAPPTTVVQEDGSSEVSRQKRKLSKRDGATSCTQFREEGFLPQAMVNYLALLGWNDGAAPAGTAPDKGRDAISEGGQKKLGDIFALDELLEAFDIHRFVKAGAAFDIEKLRWVNSQHIRAMGVLQLADLVKEQLIAKGVVDANAKSSDDFVLAVTCLSKQMMDTTADAAFNAQEVLDYQLPKSFAALREDETNPPAGGSRYKGQMDLMKGGVFYKVGRAILEAYDKNALPQPNEADFLACFRSNATSAGESSYIADDRVVGASAYGLAWSAFVADVGRSLSIKGRHLMHPIRLAMTGTMNGQEVSKQMSVVALASSSQSPVDSKGGTRVVPLSARMASLRAFLDDIPEEYRGSSASASPPSASRPSPPLPSVSAAVAAPTPSAAGSGAASNSAPSPLPPSAIPYDGPPFASLDVRVGVITKVWSHPDSEKLFCEEIDVGEGSPRLVASGLRPFFKEEDLRGRKVLVLCNLKERSLAGFPSRGMVLCASSPDGAVVSFVNPPADSAAGDKVRWAGEREEDLKEGPMPENKLAKKKAFEKIAPLFKTDEFGVAGFRGVPICTDKGPCVASVCSGLIT